MNTQQQYERILHQSALKVGMLCEEMASWDGLDYLEKFGMVQRALRLAGQLIDDQDSELWEQRNRG